MRQREWQLLQSLSERRDRLAACYAPIGTRLDAPGELALLEAQVAELREVLRLRGQLDAVLLPAGGVA